MWASAPRILLVTAVLFAASPSMRGQNLTVAPKLLRLVQVQGGPLASGSISLRSTSGAPRKWTATATTAEANDPWIQLAASAGMTPADLGVGLVSWRGAQRKPGTYHGNVVIDAGAEKLT